jgi:flagellar protein FliO/FliZ
MDMPANGLNSLLWFIAIIILIPVALWLLKRTPIGGSTSAGFMRHIATLPISQNQRIVTVEVGTGAERRWLVLGVTAQNINTLYDMPPGSELPAGTPVASPQAFSQLLGKFRKDAGDGH